MLLQMLDGGIVNITSDIESWNGCETCDYGSQYINEYKIEMTTGEIRIKVNQMYDYALSEGFMMQTILPNVDIIKNMLEFQLAEWLKEKIDEKLADGWRDVKVDVDFIEYFNLD